MATAAAAAAAAATSELSSWPGAAVTAAAAAAPRLSAPPPPRRAPLCAALTPAVPPPRALPQSPSSVWRPCHQNPSPSPSPSQPHPRRAVAAAATTGAEQSTRPADGRPPMCRALRTRARAAARSCTAAGTTATRRIEGRRHLRAHPPPSTRRLPRRHRCLCNRRLRPLLGWRRREARRWCLPAPRRWRRPRDPRLATAAPSMEWPPRSSACGRRAGRASPLPCLPSRSERASRAQ